MRLVRGWENRFSPDATGGLRLSKARRYRDVEEKGLEDQREGEVRARVPGDLAVEWEPSRILVTKEMEEQSDAEFARLMRDKMAIKQDDPEIELHRREPGKWTVQQNLKLDDSQLSSPFILCFAREPESRRGWDRLRAALPEEYDTWTLTEDVERLNFEIECGIRRWLGLNEITTFTIERHRGWVEYSYDAVPPSGSLDKLGESLQIKRWFRKGRSYKDQAEFRLAWHLQSPQLEVFPDALSIELTRTGLGLFEPWQPLER